METLSVKGRICYEDNCTLCGKSRGFVPKARLGLKCKSCSAVINKTGKPSPKKGIKSGQIPWNKGKYADNLLKKIVRNRMSRRMRHALAGRNLSKEWQHIFSIVGYSVEQLMAHLESKFQSDMTWDNIGQWHIDHKIPCASYNLENENEQKQCFNYRNLQPLWAIDNIKKAGKYL